MKRVFALTAMLLAVGCKTTSAPSDSLAEPLADDPQARQAAVVDRPFPEETLYALLVAELAGQRNRFDITLVNYVEQAKKTQDPGVAERAFRIAEYLNAHQAAFDTALIWARNAPDNQDAQRVAAIYLARAGQYEASLEFMEHVLQQRGDTHFDFLALSAIRTDSRTRAGLLQSFRQLARKYPGNAQLTFGQAILLQQDEHLEQALQVLKDYPGDERPVPMDLLQARLLQDLGRPEAALPVLRDSLEAYPEDQRLRLAYGRLLIEQDDLGGARKQFSILLEQNPDDDDLRYSLALICLEAESWQEAIGHLQELVIRDSHVNAAYLQLGRAYEAQDEPRKALEALNQVEPGNEFLPAQAQIYQMLLKDADEPAAHQHLQKIRTLQPDYAIQLYLIEIETLAEADRDDLAARRLEQAMQDNPDDLTLLYTRSMLAEKRGDLQQLEQDLRRIIEQDPENAMAYNALGYTLADHRMRLDEARQLIEQAHSLNPDDPAILDSMGWVQYRLGNLEAAEHWLRQAHENYPDAEIAAHLGEVLWMQKRQEEARSIWAQALEQQPDSPILLETLKRLTGEDSL